MAGNFVPQVPTMLRCPTLPRRRRSKSVSPTTPIFLSEVEAAPPTKPVVYSPEPHYVRHVHIIHNTPGSRLPLARLGEPFLQRTCYPPPCRKKGQSDDPAQSPRARRRVYLSAPSTSTMKGSLCKVEHVTAWHSAALAVVLYAHVMSTFCLSHGANAWDPPAARRRTRLSREVVFLGV